jgi:hypothetical protein
MNCNVKIIEKCNACVARGHQKVSVLKLLSAEHFNYSGCRKARQVDCLDGSGCKISISACQGRIDARVPLREFAY